MDEFLFVFQYLQAVFHRPQAHQISGAD